MNISEKLLLGLSTFSFFSFSMVNSALADAIYAYCEYIPYNVSQNIASMPCIYSQRQGAVGITWQDGVHSRFVPESNSPNTYRDNNGGRVSRDVNRILSGTSFDMEAGILNVYYPNRSTEVNRVSWGDINWSNAPQSQPSDRPGRTDESRTYTFSPMSCSFTSRVESSGGSGCQASKMYDSNGLWTYLQIVWGDGVVTNIDIRTVNNPRRLRLSSEYGVAIIDNSATAFYQSFSDGGVCFTTTERGDHLCIR